MSTHRTRYTDEWVPLPRLLDLTGLPWVEGSILDVEVVGDCLLIRLSDDQSPLLPHVPPARTKKAPKPQ